MRATKKVPAPTRRRKESGYQLSEVAGLLIDGTKRVHALLVAVGTIAATTRLTAGADILRHLIIEAGGVSGETLELARSLESAIKQQRGEAKR